MRRIFWAIPLLTLILMMGSTLPAHTASDSEIKYTKYADPQGELFGYIYYPNAGDLKNIDPDVKSPGEDTMVVALAELPSGKRIVEYECRNSYVEFSPDGKYALKILLDTVEKNDILEISLSKTSDDKEIWKQKLGSETGYLYSWDVQWDFENDWLVLLFSTREKLGVDFFSTHFRVHRISDGALVSEKTANLHFNEVAEFFLGNRYSRGKLYLHLFDSPFAQPRSIYSHDFKIYSIEPVGWKVLMHHIDAELDSVQVMFFVNKYGTQLYLKSHPSGERVSPGLGGDISVLNLDSGSVVPVLKADANRSYTLSGITPDGRKLCYYETRLGETGGIFSPAVLNMETYKVQSINSALNSDPRLPPNFQISQSGKYILESSPIGSDIWLHDLAAGTRKILITWDDHPGLTLTPGILGPWTPRM